MNKITRTARVQKLENDAGHEDRPAIIMDWDDTPDSELEPGTLVIEWGNDDKITTRRIKATDHTQKG